jgi:hypothetical protein
MMMTASWLRSKLPPPWLLAAALVSGCAENEPAAPPAEAVPAMAEAAPLPENAAVEIAEEQFTPPYPNRTELFIPPDLSTLAHLPTRSDGPNVVVRGFANVGGPRVVLEIDGKVRILAEGEKFEGMEVVAITPPMVSLQSGGDRWTARLSKASAK